MRYFTKEIEKIQHPKKSHDPHFIKRKEDNTVAMYIH